MDVELQLFGIPVVIRTNFWFIGLIYVLFGLRAGNPIAFILVGIFCLFVSVLWHEAGHALSATGFRLGPVAIEIHGLGGATRHRRAGEWWKNLLVTLAGPGAGLLLAALALGGYLLFPDGMAGFALSQLFAINVFLSILNMLPIYPMDGGQALRTTLNGLRVRAADLWTANVGLVGSALLFAWAMWSFVSGQSLGLFVFIAAQMVYANWELRAMALQRR
jgi:stage IV sporulation protein FB